MRINCFITSIYFWTCLLLCLEISGSPHIPINKRTYHNPITPIAPLASSATHQSSQKTTNTDSNKLVQIKDVNLMACSTSACERINEFGIADNNTFSCTEEFLQIEIVIGVNSVTKQVFLTPNMGQSLFHFLFSDFLFLICIC